MAIGLIVSTEVKGQRGQVTKKYNSLKTQSIELDWILNGLPWRSFALSECF